MKSMVFQNIMMYPIFLILVMLPNAMSLTYRNHFIYNTLTNIKRENEIKKAFHPIPFTFNIQYPNKHFHIKSHDDIISGDLCSEVYLENTDAFGILYNANYITLYQRALEEILFYTNPSIQRNKSMKKAIIIDKCEDMNYKQAAKLGDTLRIRSCLKQWKGYSNGIYSIWEQSCIREDDDTLINSVVVWARVMMNDLDIVQSYFPKSCECESKLLSFVSSNISKSSVSPSPSVSTSKSKIVQSITKPIRIYSDECQLLYIDSNDYELYGIGLLSILRYFERSRTICLGGPTKLHRFTKDGLAVVVAKINHLIQTNLPKWNSNPNSNSHSKIIHTTSSGDEIIVQNDVETRGKVAVTFHHRLYLKEKSTDNDISNVHDLPLLAEASIVLACLNVTSGRATKFPDWLYDEQLGTFKLN